MMGDCEELESNSTFRSAMLVQPSTSDGPQETVIINRPNQPKRITRPNHRHNSPCVHHHHHHRHHRHHVHPEDSERHSCCSKTLWLEESGEDSAADQASMPRVPEVSQAIDLYDDLQQDLENELSQRKPQGVPIKHHVINNPSHNFSDNTDSTSDTQTRGASHVIFTWPDALRHPKPATRLLATTLRWASHLLHHLAMLHFIPSTEYEDIRHLPWKIQPSAPPRRQHCEVIEPNW